MKIKAVHITVVLGSLMILTPIICLVASLTGCQPMNSRLVKHEPKTVIVEEASSLKHKDFVNATSEKTYIIRGYQLQEKGGHSLKAMMIVTTRTEIGRSSPATVSFESAIYMVNPKNREDAWKVIRVAEYGFDSRTNQVLWDKDNLERMHQELMLGLEEHLTEIGFTADVNESGSNIE